MTLQEFVDYWTGKPLIFSGVYGIQCMSVPHQYLYDVLNLTDKSFLAQPLARQVFQNFDNVSGHQYFEKVVNTPTNVPKPGDIMIWGEPAGPFKDDNGVQQYAGHIAVFIHGDINNFTSFDENWPLGSSPHLQAHTYDGVLGWLSPIPQQPQLTVAQVQDQLSKETAITNTCQQQLQVSTDLNKTQQDQINQLQNSISELQSKYDSEHKENLAFISEIATITNDRKNYADEVEQSKVTISKLTEYLQTIAVHTIGDPKNKPLDQVTAEVMLNDSQQEKQISDLQQEMKRYTDVKNAVSQTVGGLPASPTKSFLQKLMGIFVVQS